jgi:hypothetical protein
MPKIKWTPEPPRRWVTSLGIWTAEIEMVPYDHYAVWIHAFGAKLSGNPVVTACCDSLAEAERVAEKILKLLQGLS